VNWLHLVKIVYLGVNLYDDVSDVF
jgi:hypothetical protein